MDAEAVSPRRHVFARGSTGEQLMTRKQYCALAVTAALALIAFPPSVLAQSQAAGGQIEGTVTDQSGGVLPGVTVAIRNTATGVTRETTTDASGLYRAPLLPVGPYEVTASLAGFSTTKRPNLTLSIGQTLTADVDMKVSGAQEEVTVTAEGPVIEPARTHQATTVGAVAVANLPVNGRNFIDFVLTTPGVTRDTRSGDISFAGQRGVLNSLVIDGADNNNTFFGQTLGRTGSGRAPYQFSQDAVQEFQVNRNAYSAEYGRAGGAVINVVTKSGTNAFHGSAFEFFRDKSLNANTWANKIRTPIPARAPFRIHQFGGSLGGPIQRDKAFFFFSYDGQRRSIPNAITPLTVTVPPAVLNSTDPSVQAGLALVRTANQDYTLTRDQDVFLGKVDYQLNQQHRLSVRYNHQNFTGGNNESTGATSAEEHTGNSLVHTRSLNAVLTSVFSSTFYNELRSQWGRDEEPGAANTNSPEVTVREGSATVLVFGRNFFSPRETTIKRFQVADAVTWIRGPHALKGGFDLNFDRIFNFFPGNFGGRYAFNSLASLGRGLPNATGESYQQAFAGANTTGPETHPDLKEYAVFLQDEWKATRKLTLSFGVRYDLQDIAQPDVRNPDPQLAAAGIDTSFIKVDKNNFAPRLGFSYTPDAKTVFRAGYGLFYGRTPSIMIGTAHSGNAINVQTITFTGALVPKYPSVFATIPTGASLPRPSVQFFAPDFENPEVHQASAGLERAVGNDVAVAVSYLFVAGRKLALSRDFNVDTPVPTAIPIQGGGSLTVDRFPTRPFSNFDRLVRFESTGRSNYNGATFEVKKRFGGGFLGNLAYTLSHVKDNNPDSVNVVLGGGDDARFPSHPTNRDADYADGQNDVRHRVVLSGYWDIGLFNHSGAVLRGALGGWSLSWIATAYSGYPYSELVTNDLNNDGNRSNDLVPGSRDSRRLPWTKNIDARLLRRIPLGKQVKLELIAEAFNLLNTTNISAQNRTLYNFTGGVLVPQTNLANPRSNFGVDSSTQVNFEDTQRIVQLAAKITF
jgi:outer membrane receptor protein involved in Fe transport